MKTPVLGGSKHRTHQEWTNPHVFIPIPKSKETLLSIPTEYPISATEIETEYENYFLRFGIALPGTVIRVYILSGFEPSEEDDNWLRSQYL